MLLSDFSSQLLFCLRKQVRRFSPTGRTGIIFSAAVARSDAPNCSGWIIALWVFLDGHPLQPGLVSFRQAYAAAFGMSLRLL